jgi:autotransporter-associated beta strand protein
LSGAIDTAGNTLSLNTLSGTSLLVSGVISGSGVVTTSGAGTVALAGANTYTGVTTVTGGTLAVRHGGALGFADNTAASGTIITTTNGIVQLENGVTVTGELLTSLANVTLQLFSIGTNLTNRWTGDIDGGGSSGTSNIFLTPNSMGNRLAIDGALKPGTVQTLLVQGTSTGVVEINGAVQANSLQVNSATAEVNSNVVTINRPFVNSGGGGPSAFRHGLHYVDQHNRRS